MLKTNRSANQLRSSERFAYEYQACLLRLRRRKFNENGFVFEENLDKKSHDNYDYIAMEELRFHTVLRPHENKKPAISNSSGLKSVLEKLHFRDGLVWTVSQT